jgi:hypothetical protein
MTKNVRFYMFVQFYIPSNKINYLNDLLNFME